MRVRRDGGTRPIELTPEQYERIRANTRRFFMADGHNAPEAEVIVERHERYIVVEKVEDGGSVAEDLDPRTGILTRAPLWRSDLETQLQLGAITGSLDDGEVVAHLGYQRQAQPEPTALRPGVNAATVVSDEHPQFVAGDLGGGVNLPLALAVGVENRVGRRL